LRINTGCHGAWLALTAAIPRSKLTPLEGGAPGPAFAPMVIVGDLSSDSGSGLGMLSWWAAPEEEEPA